MSTPSNSPPPLAASWLNGSNAFLEVLSPRPLLLYLEQKSSSQAARVFFQLLLGCLAISSAPGEQIK